ncbi:adipose-regulatory protein [Aspergillus floccosus]
MELEYASDEDADPQASVTSAAMSALADFARAFFSKKAQKAYLGLILFLIVSMLMILVSTIAYGIFYYRFIPQVGLERVVHLQFGDGPPWGTTTLGPGLISRQPYDVSVELELPRTPSNIATGNFMLDLALLPHPSTIPQTQGNASVHPILRSRRPAILTFSSALVDTATKLAFMPLYVTGWQREVERLQVNMMESVEFARGWRNVPDSLRLEVHSSQTMQFYSAKVAFKARFTGLRWIMYNWKITSFLIFSFLFWNTFMASAGISWLIFASIYKGAWMRPDPETKLEEHDDVVIKKEESAEPASLRQTPPEPSNNSKKEEEYQADDESDSDTTRVPAAGPSVESSTGTGLESAEARGLQRRRSRRVEEEEDH